MEYWICGHLRSLWLWQIFENELEYEHTDGFSSECAFTKISDQRPDRKFNGVATGWLFRGHRFLRKSRNVDAFTEKRKWRCKLYSMHRSTNSKLSSHWIHLVGISMATQLPSFSIFRLHKPQYHYLKSHTFSRLAVYWEWREGLVAQILDSFLGHIWASWHKTWTGCSFPLHTPHILTSGPLNWVSWFGNQMWTEPVKQ